MPLIFFVETYEEIIKGKGFIAIKGMSYVSLDVVEEATQFLELSMVSPKSVNK